MKPINRILISRMKYIGDVVLTTPIIHAVREKYSHAYIAYLGDKKAVSLLEHNPYLDEIIPYDFDRPSLIEQLRVIRLLQAKKFDVFIDLFSNPRSALIARLSGAAMRIGKEVRGRGSLYTHRIRDDGTLKPAIDFHYQYLQPLGIEPSYRRVEIFLTEEEKQEAHTYLKSQGVDETRPLVAVHPGATWPNKMWFKENFARLIYLMKTYLYAEVLLSPGPEDRNLVDTIAQECLVAVHKLPVFPLRQLAAVLSCCQVFVTNDCGPMHIAAAVGTKTLGIFGPEPTEVWFNYSQKDGHKAFFKKIFCSPCRKTSCYRKGEGYMECMKLLTVEELFEEVKNRLVDVSPKPLGAAGKETA